VAPRAATVCGGQIVGKQVNEDVVVTLVAENPTFLDEQQVLYQSMRSARNIRRE